MDMPQVAELLYFASPRLEGAVTDGGLCHVVYDHRSGRVAFDEPDGVEHVARFDKCIQARAKLEHRVYDRIEFSLEDPGFT
jgi:hypothetical protein